MKTRKMRGPPMKYSEVVLQFGEPLLRLITADAPPAARKHVMSLVITVWNAVAVDQALGGSRYEDELWRTIPSMPGPLGELISTGLDELVQRKKSSYVDQRWTIGRWELLGAGADLRLRVEAHAPPERADD